MECRHGGTTTYAYDHSGTRVYQASGTSTPIFYFNKFYRTNGASHSDRTRSVFFPTNSGEIFAIENHRIGTATGYNNYISGNPQGSTNIVTWSNPAYLAELADYYPYGGVRQDSNTNYDTPRKFLSQFYDKPSGIDYLNARYYFGSTGQFSSK